MSTTVEKIASNKVKLSFDIDSAKFDEAMGKAYLKVRNQVTIPGFRKGKAPRKMIENMYGEGVFYDEAFELIFDEVYGPAVDENKIEVVDRPEIEIQEIGAGKNLKFTCEVFVKPDVTLGEYKGVSVKKETTVVTDVEVDARVEEERNKQATEIQVEDRAVAEGDTVNLDYAGTVDGVAFAGGTAQDQTLKIGSGSFIPGFEEQMIGMNIGEEKDLQVTFPEKYHAEELAGKAAVFHVKVNSITETQLPALDDDFAKDISEFDTLEEYKADIRAKLEAQAAERDNNNFTNAVIEKVLENATVEIPEAMIERQIDSMMRDFEYRLMGNGLKLDDFLKYTGSDMKAFRENYRGQAEKSVKAHLVLEAIEKAEAIDATQEQIDKQLEAFAAQTGKTVEEFKASLSESDIEYFKADAIRDNCVKFLADNAKIEA
ncbi:MAG: trigger factor [Clostridiales bacterium]|nr:trigger factor [Clostridiales bacterium]MDY3763967.1 trigger factor [Candidatus Ventricola sp.]MCI7704014.1 trigger factor [Clostridiales bacterium]MDY3831195.1 trigger factor [Candidatus Ventricola sp.]MDY4541923.1 trigger factor [Candidatus Ventricola sp.]